MDAPSQKRKAEPEDTGRSDDSSKKPKRKKQWSKPRKDSAEARGIQPGDVGIWATCAKGQEGKSVAELRDLFQEYADKLYGTNQTSGAADDGVSDDEADDIEAEIQKEIDGIRKPSTDALFTSIKLDTQCLLFFKTRAPVEPVSFVHTICQDAASGVGQKRCRYVNRLTPMTAIARATESSLEEIAQRVLAPHFYGPEQAGKKFAIRPTIRNNKLLKRNTVIENVAALVGPGHKVNLSGYDVIILVDVYQNICGMSVVGPDYDKLKRYNLTELRDPSKPDKDDPERHEQ